MNVKDLFEKHADQIEKVITLTAQKKNIKGELQNDFSSYVYEKLLENDGKRLRSFKGDYNASWNGYLSVVILRLAIDFIKKQWGRWENSTTARVLGEVAMELEALLYRDRISFSDACTHLLEHPGLSPLYRLSENELGKLRQILPETIVQKLSVYQKPAFYIQRTFDELLRQVLTKKETKIIQREEKVIKRPLTKALLAEWDLLFQNNHAARKLAVLHPQKLVVQGNSNLDVIENLQDYHQENPLEKVINTEISAQLEVFLDQLLATLSIEDKTIISLYLGSNLNISEVARIVFPQSVESKAVVRKTVVSTKSWKQVNKRIQQFMSQIQKKIATMEIDSEDWANVAQQCLISILKKI